MLMIFNDVNRRRHRVVLMTDHLFIDNHFFFRTSNRFQSDLHPRRVRWRFRDISKGFLDFETVPMDSFLPDENLCIHIDASLVIR